jgi:LuxR family transcriptional regulator, maltose regulon positive regulatory protein
MPYIETPRLTQARVLLAQGGASALDEAAAILTRLVEHVTAIHNVPKRVEALALLALVYAAQGRTELALDTLESALTPARPGGYVTVFVELGAPMAALLRQLAESRAALPARHPSLARYITQLRAAFPGALAVSTSTSPEPEPGPISAAPVIEPLTGREIDVLRLLARRYTYKEIAAELVITVGTVKVHVQNIYGKLDVDNRRDAVARALALGLISAGADAGLR